jgi:hypothetical protein
MRASQVELPSDELVIDAINKLRPLPFAEIDGAVHGQQIGMLAKMLDHFVGRFRQINRAARFLNRFDHFRDYVTFSITADPTKTSKDFPQKASEWLGLVITQRGVLHRIDYC